MFLREYVDDFYFDLILEEYEKDFLDTLDEKHFNKIYNIFNREKFYFIEDIILKYLDLFTFDEDIIEKGLKILKMTLKDNYVNMIGNDLRYLEVFYKLI